VGDRPLTDIARDVARRIKDVKFPFEYHAEMQGEHEERRAFLRSTYGYMAAAAVLIFLVVQAAVGSWRLAALSLVGVPIALLGSFIAVAIADGAFSLGSLLGLVTVLGLTVRQGLGLVSRFQDLERQEGMGFGEELIRRGLAEQLNAILASSAVTALVVLPFVVMGDVAGLEIAHPIAVVVLGGIVTSLLAILFVAPALYLRFGRNSAADRLGLEPAAVP